MHCVYMLTSVVIRNARTTKCNVLKKDKTKDSLMPNIFDENADAVPNTRTMKSQDFRLMIDVDEIKDELLHNQHKLRYM